MKTYICQICGDAYLGHERPGDCPFCGAAGNFLKEGDGSPVLYFKVDALGELTRKNLEFSLELERKATAIYACMADKADSYEVKAMFKRLSKVEMEHVSIFSKMLGVEKPAIDPQECSESDIENFKTTLALEENATNEYFKFAREATEPNAKIVFTAIAGAEKGHIELIQNYLK